MKRINFGVLPIILVILGLVALFDYVDLNHRVSKLEEGGKGHVDVFLEPISEDFQYHGPKLFNNNTKIVLNDKREFRCLAENVFFESGHQSYIGKIAVLQTVLNRAESGRWGYSFCDVIHAKKQFSWTLKDQKNPHGSAWVASKDAVKAFLNGVRVKNLEEVDHYHATYISPYWNRNMRETATIGDHVFYASK
jgi:spore germination cell wall hydrolase CwlJ-like protein